MNATAAVRSGFGSVVRGVVVRDDGGVVKFFVFFVLFPQCDLFTVRLPEHCTQADQKYILLVFFSCNIFGYRMTSQ
jgi:hypothetical protein